MSNIKKSLNYLTSFFQTKSSKSAYTLHLQDSSTRVTYTSSAPWPHVARTATLHSAGPGSLGAFWKIRGFILIPAPLVFEEISQDSISSGTLILSATLHLREHSLRSQDANFSQSKSGFTEADTSAGVSTIYGPPSSFTVMIRQRYTFLWLCIQVIWAS